MVLIVIKKNINDFYITLHSSNEEEIYDALKRLNPDKLNLDQKLELIHFVQNKKFPIHQKHYNSFGTGGDKLKTMNISTMSSIIASNFVDIYKIGTGSVTSMWGSVDFIEQLNVFKKDLSDTLKLRVSYKEGSGYISLNNLGFPYSISLRKARRELDKNGILDIYKLVFPVSNFTNSRGQVNGVCKLNYISHFVDISRALERNSLIVYSDYDIDEIIIGKNKIIRIYQGSVTESDLTISGSNIDAYMDFISESDNITKHVLKFIKIIKGDCPEEVIWTIAYNAACILNLEYQSIIIDTLAQKIFKYMTSFYKK